MHNERQLWICGDIHGELSGLVRNAVNRGISCADILVVGDFGAGFGRPKSMDVAYGKVRAALEKNDICIYTIRGNHDNPAFFDGKHDYDRLHFLPDHSIVELCGKRIYPVGGAVSEDIDFVDPQTRKSRRMINNSLIRSGSSKRVWWPDEAPTQIAECFPTAVDIVVSHEAPLMLAPLTTRPNHMREKTFLKILESRIYLDFVMRAIKPSHWFYGHYHFQCETSIQFPVRDGEESPRKIHCQCLDIAEMTQIT